LWQFLEHFTGNFQCIWFLFVINDFNRNWQTNCSLVGTDHATFCTMGNFQCSWLADFFWNIYNFKKFSQCGTFVTSLVTAVNVRASSLFSWTVVAANFLSLLSVMVVRLVGETFYAQTILSTEYLPMCMICLALTWQWFFQTHPGECVLLCQIKSAPPVEGAYLSFQQFLAPLIGLSSLV